MTLKRSAGLSLAAAALLAPAGEAQAQDEPPPPPRQETELVFEREVFQYPAFTRRNPFRVLSGPAGGGPRFETLSLIGIIYSADANVSVAVLTTGGVTVAADGTTSPIAGESYSLKVGDRLGNTTIVEIRRDEVIVEVEVFDSVERETMNFNSRRQGGTP